MADKRQELYDRIRSSSKDTVILEEMIRLGFWPARGVVPNDPADEIHEQAELERQLTALRTEQSRLHNIEALKKVLRKQRLDASKQKQQGLLARAKELAAKHGWQPPKRPPPKPPAGPAGGGGPSGRPPEPPAPEPASPEPSSPAPAKKKKWWQVF
jgi:hypothetical protein